MTYGYIATQGELNQIESAIRNALNVPIIGRNAKTGDLEPTKAQTTSFSVLLMITGPKRYAIVGTGASVDEWVAATGITPTPQEQAYIDAFKAGIVELGSEWDDATIEPWAI